ncbi:MAG: hypothetical protein AAF153_00460, partial [Pseudomonadota bacterium]
YNAGDIPKDEFLDELNAGVRNAYDFKRYEVLNRLIDNYERPFKIALDEIQHLPPERHPLNIMQYFVDRLDTDASWALPEYDGSISEASKRQHRQQTYEHFKKLLTLPGVTITPAISATLETKLEAFPKGKRAEISRDHGTNRYQVPDLPPFIVEQDNEELTATYRGELPDSDGAIFMHEYAETTHRAVAPAITSDYGARQKVDNTDVKLQLAFDTTANVAAMTGGKTAEVLVKGGQAIIRDQENKKVYRAAKKFRTTERAYEVLEMVGAVLAGEMGLYECGIDASESKSEQLTALQWSKRTIDTLSSINETTIHSRLRASDQARLILAALHGELAQQQAQSITLEEATVPGRYTAAQVPNGNIAVDGKGCACTIM